MWQIQALKFSYLLHFSLSTGGSERFSAGMAILNLIIRPFTTLVLYRVYVERANAAGAPIPPIFGESSFYLTVFLSWLCFFAETDLAINANLHVLQCGCMSFHFISYWY